MIKVPEDSVALIDGVTETVQHEIKYKWVDFFGFYNLSNFDFSSNFNYESRFNGAFSRNKLTRIKDVAHVINLDDKKSKGTHWASLCIDKSTATHFDYLGIEYIPQELLKNIKDNSISQNIFRIQDNDSIMFAFYCIVFIEYMIAGKALIDYTGLIFPTGFKKNSKIIYKCFEDKYGKSWI